MNKKYLIILILLIAAMICMTACSQDAAATKPELIAADSAAPEPTPRPTPKPTLKPTPTPAPKPLVEWGHLLSSKTYADETNEEVTSLRANIEMNFDKSVDSAHMTVTSTNSELTQTFEIDSGYTYVALLLFQDDGIETGVEDHVTFKATINGEMFSSEEQSLDDTGTLEKVLLLKKRKLEYDQLGPVIEWGWGLRQDYSSSSKQTIYIPFNAVLNSGEIVFLVESCGTAVQKSFTIEGGKKYYIKIEINDVDDGLKDVILISFPDSGNESYILRTDFTSVITDIEVAEGEI